VKTNIFWIFGILQSAALGAIIFLVFNLLNALNEPAAVGKDTQLVLSLAFPLFNLIMQYINYRK
jgi:hypothetical protein